MYKISSEMKTLPPTYAFTSVAVRGGSHVTRTARCNYCQSSRSLALACVLGNNQTPSRSHSKRQVPYYRHTAESTVPYTIPYSAEIPGQCNLLLIACLSTSHYTDFSDFYTYRFCMKFSHTGELSMSQHKHSIMLRRLSIDFIDYSLHLE